MSGAFFGRPQLGPKTPDAEAPNLPYSLSGPPKTVTSRSGKFTLVFSSVTIAASLALGKINIAWVVGQTAF